jgi:hypothetical protein
MHANYMDRPLYGQPTAQRADKARPASLFLSVERKLCALRDTYRVCDGFSDAGPITELATRTTAAGPAFESRQCRKPRERGHPYQRALWGFR